ncbi:MAG TPA: hypothetical protein VGM88_01950 [Kofleriaceae bacterium]|jgi:hypothetical protein
MKQPLALVFLCGSLAGCLSQDTDDSRMPTPSTSAPQAVRPADVTSGTWTPLPAVPFSSAGMMLLMTDGTLLVSEVSTPRWWRLTPDNMGSYMNGTWSQTALMPNNYAPLYFGSGILPDGRVMVEGGEYLNGNSEWTTRGAVYDPVADAWSNVAPPSGWNSIGDASAVVLPDGTYMQSDCCSTNSALLNPADMSWTPTGVGKQGDSNDEESWSVLWDGTILTVDCNNLVNLMASEVYTPSTGMWTLGANTANKTCDVNSDGSGSRENGPQVVRFDGTVFAVGGTGHNDIYDQTSKTWTAGPDSPVTPQGQMDSADGPAVLMPNGNELIAMSPGVYGSPTHFYEWDGVSLTQVNETPNSPSNSSYNQNFMLLPTGEVLLTDFTPDIELYTPADGTPFAGAAPVIQSAPVLVTAQTPDPYIDFYEPNVQGVEKSLALSTLSPGHTYKLQVQRMNGLSETVAYGDDAQPATNYPLARFTNQTTGHVLYARTHNHSNRAIGPDQVGTTMFDVPETIEQGLTTFEIVTNGIASPGVIVNIK